MDTQPLISVILPAYNAEAMVARTLDNLVSTQFASMNGDTWEIIAVDDGSADSTLALLRQWEARYPKNIHVLTGANGGLSRARNRGMSVARGEWLYFMDADDLLLPESLPRLMEVTDGVDVVRFRYRETDEESAVCAVASTVAPERLHVTGMMSGLEYLSLTEGLLPYGGCDHTTYTLFIRHSFIKSRGLQFVADVSPGEDNLFTWELMLADPRVAVCSDELYMYIFNPTSIMHRIDPAYLRRKGQGGELFVMNLMGLYRAHMKEFSPLYMPGLRAMLRNSADASMLCAILGGEPVSEIWGRMRRFKSAGISVKPGRPRLRGRKVSSYTGIRRWMAAYMLPVVMGIADCVRGKGLWSDSDMRII